MTNKNVFANNLKRLMTLRNKSRNDLSKDLDISYYTVTDWVNGKKYPRMDKVEKLANYFGVLKSELIEENLKGNNLTPRKIPVLGTVRAGLPTSAVENIIDYEEIPEEMARNGEYFGLVIKGDSMEPKFSEGDVAIVRKQETVPNGSIAVVLVNGEDATIKKFFRSESGIKLISLNQRYEPFFYPPAEVDSLPVTVVGKVVELRAKFD